MKQLRKAFQAVRLGVALLNKAPQLLRPYRFPRAAERLLDDFASEPTPSTAYDGLMRYMAASWATYRNAAGSGASYPGLPSWSGADCDELEGFARIMPMFGAWSASGRATTITVADGTRVSLAEEFKRGLLAGTDPDAPTYWGDMPGRSNQRIVEAADIALALWLFRDTVWSELTPAERGAVVNWLSLVEGRQGIDNNWHLFFVLIDRVLAALGQGGRISGVRERFDRIKDFHLGNGWFTDGQGGRVDFYNAWGFHYSLTWIDRIDPQWDPTFIHATQSAFLQSYKYLIGPQGLPILGRSVHYRIAAAAPLVAGAESHPDVVSPGEARRALDATWRYFISRGALRRGVVSSGYHEACPQSMDPYSGPASSFWSLRSLVMAFYYGPGHDFWNAPPEPLPVERESFEFTLPAQGWKVTGERSTGTIIIEVLANPIGAAPELEPFGRLDVLKNLAYGVPTRPKSMAAKYGRRLYRSDEPFCTPTHHA